MVSLQLTTTIVMLISYVALFFLRLTNDLALFKTGIWVYVFFWTLVVYWTSYICFWVLAIYNGIVYRREILKFVNTCCMFQVQRSFQCSMVNSWLTFIFTCFWLPALVPFASLKISVIIGLLGAILSFSLPLFWNPAANKKILRHNSTLRNTGPTKTGASPKLRTWLNWSNRDFRGDDPGTGGGWGSGSRKDCRK